MTLTRNRCHGAGYFSASGWRRSGVERSLLEVAAVFEDGWTLEAAARVAGLDEDQALELSEALARHSLIYLDSTGAGPRSRMLGTIRAFVADQLADRPDAAEIHRRHAGYFRALAGQADRPLRGAGQNQWLDRLEAEAGNLAAAVRWHVAHDPSQLPNMFRVLWPFWSLRDHLREARAWVDQLVPAAGSLDPEAQAELLWTAAVTANQVGDRAAALAATRRLAPLLEHIDDPYLRALSRLAMGWASMVTGDPDGAIQQESASLEELRGQDEPYWTASRAWPTLRPTETELMTKLRQALGADRLDEVFSAGSRLNQQQAVAAVQDRRGTPAQTS